MVSETLKDIDDEDDVSVDENDPELLGELNAIAGTNLFYYEVSIF